MVVLVILEVVALAVALYLGIGGDGSGGIGQLERDLLGRGEVRSEPWLRIAWVMLAMIAVTLFVGWRMGIRFVAGDDAEHHR